MAKPLKFQLRTFRGYKISVRPDQSPPVSVFDPRYLRDPAIFRADTIEKAETWIVAYRNGINWAIDEKAVAFEVTEAEYAAAKADESQDAWQVVRCCNGWPSVAGMVKKWLVKYRAKNSADLSTDAKLDALAAQRG